MSRHTPRLYVDRTLAVGDQVQPDQGQTHHLLNVLRLRAGDEVRLFNGNQGEYLAIASIPSKREIQLDIESFESLNRESRIRITLAQGIARGERMDYAIQKSVELGATEIQPLHTERSQRIPGNRADKKLAHWQAVAQSAAEQSGRTIVPTVHPAQDLLHWLANTDKTAARWLLDPEAGETLRKAKRADSCLLLIGPESGLTENEVGAARQQGFQGIRLGPRILRTETAGPATIGAIQTLWGDFT